MHETFGERLEEKIYGGAGWEIKYNKSEIKNAEYYIRENKRIIESYKRKYPHTWRKRVGGFLHDIKFYENQKKENLAKMRRWEAIQKAHRKMKTVI